MRTYAIVMILPALLAFGCSKQGEGERCDTNSGNLDCDTGLICRTPPQPTLQSRGVAICCPGDGVAPTQDACRAGAELPPEPGFDAGVVVETDAGP
jgi:hypothetical protein